MDATIRIRKQTAKKELLISMIYTFTLNPSLDCIYSVDSLSLSKLNRASSTSIFPGGKGINVSTVLKNFGIDSTAMGFVGGFTGNEIERLLIEKGIHTDFVHLSDATSRINVKVSSTEETEINAPGPFIDENKQDEFFSKLSVLVPGDIAVLSGSVPPGIDCEFYANIISRLSAMQVTCIVDAEGAFLLKTLPFHPFLIKPNKTELEKIFDTKIKTKDEAVVYAKKLIEDGAVNVIVSLGSEGAVFVSSSNQVFLSDAPKGKVISSVGAGDSMIAGFLSDFLENKDNERAFKKAVCTGSATTFSSGLATKEDVFMLLSSWDY